MTNHNQYVESHYTITNLGETILSALRQMGKDLNSLRLQSFFGRIGADMGQVGANQARGDTLDGVAEQAGSLANEYHLTLGHQVCQASTIGGGGVSTGGLVIAKLSAVADGGQVAKTPQTAYV